jgi:hypothetical protein
LEGISLLSTKEMMWLVIGIIALLVVIFWRRRENMTNKDLVDTLVKFSDKGKEVKKKEKEPKELQIYGPKAERAEPSPASKADVKSENGGVSGGVYPDIYGPEITPMPGKKVDKGMVSSDDGLGLDEPEFNPDLKKAFPTSGEPQPFLTDFSKFQH